MFHLKIKLIFLKLYIKLMLHLLFIHSIYYYLFFFALFLHKVEGFFVSSPFFAKIKSKDFLGLTPYPYIYYIKI